MSTSIPSPTPTCAVGSITDAAPSSFPRPYCAMNWPLSIPSLSTCCAPNTTVHTADNCTQYCSVTDYELSRWRRCVIDLEPDTGVTVGNAFPCFLNYTPPSSSSSTQTSSSTTTSSAFPFSTHSCNPSRAYSGLENILGNDLVSAPFCQRNWGLAIPGLERCCKTGAKVQTFRNCTQYCEVEEGDVDVWKECVVGLREGMREEDTRGFENGMFACDPAESSGLERASAVGVIGWVVAVLALGSVGVVW